MLLDPQGRNFSYLRLSITDLCNYRCNYCLPDGFHCDNKAHYLSLDEIANIVQSFARHGISKVRITGGEPSLRRDLCEIISLIKSTPGIKKVAMTTNGHHLSRHVKSWQQAGLDALNISCDSLDPRMMKAIVGRDNLADLLQGIDDSIESGIKQIKVNTVLLKQYNFQDLEQLIDWASQKPITLRFIELMQTQDNHQYFTENHISANEVLRLLTEKNWIENLRDHHAGDGPAREFSHPDFLGKIGFIAPYSKDFCKTCNRLRVSSQGKLHLCLFGDSGYELRPFIANGDPAALDDAISQFLTLKPDAHFLHQGYSGGTSDLAMIGG